MLEAQSGNTGVEVSIAHNDGVCRQLLPASVLTSRGTHSSLRHLPAPSNSASASRCPPALPTLPLPTSPPLQVNGKNPATALLDSAAALNISVLRVFATGVEPQLPLQVQEGKWGRLAGCKWGRLAVLGLWGERHQAGGKPASRQPGLQPEHRTAMQRNLPIRFLSSFPRVDAA